MTAWQSSYPAKLALGRGLRRALMACGHFVVDEVQGKFYMIHPDSGHGLYLDAEKLRAFAKACRREVRS